jgi:alpha-tubulin suppressor-like RCC1 family protein
VPVPAGSAFTYNDVSAGQQTCGVRTDNVGLCWGFAFRSTIANPVLTPLELAPGVSFSAISAGFNHSCGLSTGGAAHCWGNNFAGQLGDGTTGGEGPSPVSGGLTFTKISVGRVHTCGISTGGQGYCWGDNELGQLGIGSASGFAVLPTQIAGGLMLKDISAGTDHTCAVNTDDAVHCWGYASKLGTGIPPMRLSPTAVVFP